MELALGFDASGRVISIRAPSGAEARLFTGRFHERSSAGDLVCPPYWELVWSFGCPMRCAWCYLQGVFGSRMEPRILPMDEVRAVIRKLAELAEEGRLAGMPGGRLLLNTGELSDSLMAEAGERPLTITLHEALADSKRARALLVTKMTETRNLLKRPMQDVIVVSFSLNAPEAARRWERGAPGVDERLRAAEELADAGYEVRIRIDPIVPYEGWREGYEELLEMIFRRIEPARITLGTLRGVRETVEAADDRSWVEFLDEETEWGWRPSKSTRLRLYSSILELLENYGYRRVSLCKESIDVWKELRARGFRISPLWCNCMP